MKIIRMIKTMAGPDGTFTAGMVRKVDDAEAAALVDIRVAELVADIAAGPLESAALEPATEKAVPKAARKTVKK